MRGEPFATLVVRSPHRSRLPRKQKKAMKRAYFDLLRNVSWRFPDDPERRVRRHEIPAPARRAERRAFKWTRIVVERTPAREGKR